MYNGLEDVGVLRSNPIHVCVETADADYSEGIRGEITKHKGPV